MHKVLRGLILIFSHLYMQLLKSLYFPYSVALALCQNQLNIYIYIYVGLFLDLPYSGPVMYISIFFSSLNSLDAVYSIRVNLEIRYGNASSFLFKIVPAILGIADSRISFRISIKSMLWSID